MRRKTEDKAETPEIQITLSNGNGHSDTNGTHSPAPSFSLEDLRARATVLNTKEIASAGPVYQREVNRTHVKRLMNEWDWIGFGTPVVNQRPDGSYWLVDGQHRVSAMRSLFGDRDIEVLLHHLPGIPEEARLYRLLNAVHLKTSGRNLLAVRIAERDPVALDIEKVVDEAGFTLCLHGPQHSNLDIVQVASLVTIYEDAGTDSGADALSKVLKFVKATWGGKKQAVQGGTFEGVASFLSIFETAKHFDMQKVAEVLSDYPPDYVRDNGDNVTVDLKKKHGPKKKVHRHWRFALGMAELWNRNAPAKEKLPMTL